jgi:hypothetical protein
MRAASPTSPTSPAAPASVGAPGRGMAWIPGGEFWMGSAGF